jgi:arabinoxylan arabinofuranohydrolase
MIMKKIYILLFLAFITVKGNAQNPIVPPGVYIADPSAHVWNGGKLYVYGSRDESPEYYCSWSYRVLSTNDLKKWELSGESFSSKGQNDQVPENDALLFAPDVQYKNGRYYLYYCMFGAEGVAVSDSPLGPFKNGTPIDLKGINQIDPCVFIDSDGQGYFIWGQFNAKMARMNPDMKSIDISSIKENVVTQQEHFFHEGSYMIKHDSLYYLLYADLSRAGKPTCLGYSTSKSPMGPYTYRGVIIDNDNCDPAVWNNHGSLVEYKGQWYVFYHRSTNGSVTMRKACLEPITFRADGSIPEVEMTSQGAGGPLDAFQETDAARACLFLGNIRIRTIAKDNEVLGEIRNGDKVAFKYFNFRNGADSISMRISPGFRPCKIELCLDDLWSNSLGSVTVPAKQGDEWITIKAHVKSIQGVHALWLRFSDPAVTNMYGFPIGINKGIENELCRVDAFQFKSSARK